MSIPDVTLTTLVDREDKPKAVFYGQTQDLIHELGAYLDVRSVDLFTAQKLSDAFFGDYFFYIGNLSDVKDFIASESRRLPKTLLILTQASEKIDSLVLDKSPIKVAWIGEEPAVSTQLVEKLINFFLGSSDLELDLAMKTKSTPPPNGISAPLIDNSEVEEEVSVSQVKPIKKEEEITVLPQKAQVAAETVVAKDAQVARENKIRSFYDLPPVGQKSQPKAPRPGLVVKSALITLFLLVILPIFILGATGPLGLFFLMQTQHQLLSGNLSQSKVFAQIAKVDFQIATATSSIVTPLLVVLGQRDLAHNVEALSEGGVQTSQTVLYVLAAAEDAKTLFAAISATNQGVAQTAVISEMKGDLKLAETELSLVEAELKPVSFSFPGSTRFGINSKLADLLLQITQARELILSAEQGLTLLPEAVGLNGQRTYLVVFQNNMELRPTGGFIGSYGLAKFDQGKLIDLNVEDIYAADGALEGHVDPPEALRVYLGQEHWYMRDANWQPDFSQSAARLAWFLEKELQVNVDGVVAVDLDLIRSLLGVTGPIELSDFNQTLDVDNLFSTLHEQIESDFFPGSTHKKDLLGALSRSLIERVTSLQPDKALSLAQALYTGLNERHLQLFFVNPTVEQLVGGFGWAGKQELPQCREKSCIADFSQVVDANLGVNKANYYIKRTITDEAQMSTQTIDHHLSIHYRNDSPGSDKLGGTYKNYLRVYVPKNVASVSAQLNEQQLTLTEDPIATSSTVVANPDGDFRVLAALVEILPQTESMIIFDYQLPTQVDGLEFTYRYKMQKQAGTGGDQVSFKLLYPPEWQVVSESGKASVAAATSLVNESQISYNTSLTQDYDIELTIKP